jgi:type IV fimbrial biogenesis protein FimT
MARRGFTLVEMMITLAVAAVLIGLAAPAFNDYLAQRRMTNAINDLALAITYARSEAARLGVAVSVQAAEPSAGNEWGGGFCVVEGAPGDCDPPVLRVFSALADHRFDGVAGVDGDLDGVSVLTFDSRGLLVSGVGGAVELCADAGAQPGRLMRINVTGRASIGGLQCDD